MNITLKKNETMQDLVERLAGSFELVYDIAPVAYWWENLNEDGRIKDIHFSKRMRDMLGYKSVEEFPDELNTLMTFTHPEDVHLMLDDAIRAGTGQIDKYDVQYRIRKADGSYMWCNATGELVKDCEGKTVGMYGAFIDITEEIELQRKQIEQEEVAKANRILADNNASILALEDNFLSLYDVDLETGSYVMYVRKHLLSEEKAGDMVNSNDFFADTLTNVVRVIIPEDREGIVNVLNRKFIVEALEKERSFDWRYRLITEGEPAWARLRFAYKDEDKKHIIVGAFNAEDEMKVKELPQLQKTLDELNAARLRNDLVIGFVNGIRWSYEIGPNDEIIAANYDKSLIETYDFDHPEDPMAWVNIVHPDDKERVLEEFMGAIRDHSGKTQANITYRIKDLDGKYYWHKISGRILFREDGTRELFGISVDINDQMEEQQKHLLGAVPISPDILAKENIGMWAFELDEGKPPRMYGDDAMLKLVGLDQQVTPEEMYHAWYDHIDEGSYDLVSDAVDKMASGEHAEVQYPWNHPDGYTMIVRCGGVRNPEYTKGMRIEGTHQNVTEVLHFNEDEMRLIKRMNMIYSLSDEFDPIFVLDPVSGEYDWFESRADEIEELTAMSVHGTDFYKDIGEDTATIIHDEDREQFKAVYNKENMMKVAETGQMQETENRWKVGPDNTYLWKYNKIVRMIDENGKAYVVVGVVDTTEKKEQERQQKRYFALSDYFIKSYTTAYYVDIAKSTLQTLNVKEGIISTLDNGMSYEEAVMDYAENYIIPEDRENLIEMLSSEYMRNRLQSSTDYTFVFRDISEDSPGIYRCNIFRGYDEDHVAIGFLNITEEVEEQEKQQKQLQDALAMAESANRAKTTFLNNMSHDIRTPMNAIIGYAGLAASHIDHKEQVQDYLNKIGQSSDHLLSLINDVLDMSRIESGKMNINEKEENLSEIIHSLRDIVQSDLRAKQLDFYVDAVDVNDENVICDKLRLNQVLLNIMSNAIKYTAAGGTVVLRVREKAVKPSGYGTFEFVVKDNGMGMSKEFVQTIFDPFTRVKSSTVSGIQGTGLGMAITKNIVDMFGGKIEIKSELGKGTEVIITADLKLQNEPRQPEKIPELSGVRGLVVDDDSNTCMSIANMLRDTGMRPEWCTSGREAVIRAAEGYRIGDLFKVYIIDWMMPDMNGIETTRRIRKEIGDDVPIIVITAYDWTDIEDEAREAGVTAFASKPVFPSDLHRILNNCLGKEAETAEIVEEYDFAGNKILLVEDNELNLEIATELLEECGFAVDTAVDGDIAVEKMRAAKPGDYDLVLMDIQMPKMDGYEATRQIRALGTEISKIPILAMTANAFEEDRKLALEAGMNEHIAKPIDIEKLKAMLAKFL